MNALLLPVALAQGLWVRLRVPRLPAAAGTAGRCGAGPGPLEVVGVGDSIIAGVGVARQEDALTGQFARVLHARHGRAVHWRVRGANGATAAELCRELAPRAGPADVYLVSIGVNDAVRGTAPRRFRERLERAVATLRRQSADAAVIFGGIPPLASFPALRWPLGAILGERAAALQAAARELARSDGRLVCWEFPGRLPDGGFARDGFHPGADACAQWARWLLESCDPLSPRAGAARRCGSAASPASRS